MFSVTELVSLGIGTGVGVFGGCQTFVSELELERSGGYLITVICVGLIGKNKLNTGHVSGKFTALSTQKVCRPHCTEQGAFSCFLIPYTCVQIQQKTRWNTALVRYVIGSDLGDETIDFILPHITQTLHVWHSYPRCRVVPRVHVIPRWSVWAMTPSATWKLF